MPIIINMRLCEYNSNVRSCCGLVDPGTLIHLYSPGVATCRFSVFYYLL